MRYGIITFIRLNKSQAFTQGALPYDWIVDYKQVAFEVAVNGVRLPKPENCPVAVYQLIQKCWAMEQKDRPSFYEILHMLKSAQETVQYQLAVSN